MIEGGPRKAFRSDKPDAVAGESHLASCAFESVAPLARGVDIRFEFRIDLGSEPDKLVDQLAAESSSDGPGFKLSALQDRLGIGQEEIRRLAAVLESEEIIQVDGGRARLAPGTLVADYLRTRTSGAASESSAAGELIAAALKRAPRLMSREYRRAAAVGLTEALAGFDMQEVPRALLDHRLFRDRVGSEGEDEALAAVFADGERIVLPQVVHVASIAEYLPAFAEVTEPERAVAARR